MKLNAKEIRPCVCNHAESKHVPLTAKEKKDMPRLTDAGILKCKECAKAEYRSQGARGPWHKFEFDALRYVCWVSDAREGVKH